VAGLAELPQVPATARRDGRTRLAQRKRELREDWRERHLGPQGEEKSRDIVGKVKLVPLEEIVSDTDFKNEMRLDATEDEAQNLEESMRSEGLKQPVVLIEHGDEYHVRWGFRRVKAARKLGWQAIPAIVLPADTPLPSQYWSNIVENVARSKMHTYEIARSAQVMRDKFRVNHKEFSRRTGYDPKYIDNLLRTIDNLPPELLQKWRERRPIPVDYFITWASMRPDEAVTSFNTYVGLHPRAARSSSSIPEPPKTKRGDFPLLMATKAGLKRMDRLRFSIACHRTIDDSTRDTWLAIVDFCMGQRNDVPGVHDDNRKHKSHRGRDGKRSKIKQTDVACFRLAGAGEPAEVTDDYLTKLEKSVNSLDKDQASKLLELLRQTR
jgi:ParB/RepB/Spo0J family partition protein